MKHSSKVTVNPIILLFPLCVAGLFDYSHMAYDAERYESGPRSQPSLSEMTEKAIKILRKNEKGFFLFVEGV